MSVFTSLIIIILAMVIQACLQLAPGVFAIFYHYALGKTTAKKADDRSLSFILGIEICSALIFLAIYITVSFFVTEKEFLNTVFRWILSGIFLAEAFFCFFFYYKSRAKKSKSTELFLSRHFVRNTILRVEQSKNRSDTIILGIITCALELFITLPLYIICSIEIPNISPTCGFLFIIAYIIIATIPLFTIRSFFRVGRNLAEIQLIRLKQKFPVRIILTVCFTALSVITIIIGVNT